MRPPDAVAVLVVGGGPSGLAAAIELGRRGIEVLVVEPRTVRDPLRPRAKTTSVRTMEHLRRWGLADRLRAACPLPVEYAQDVVFCTGLFGHEITRFREAFGLTADRRDEYAEPGQQAPQSTVEEVLRDAAAALPSVTLLEGWRVTEVVDGATTARATLLSPGGGEHTVTAGWLLGCDGSAGVTRAAIGARYEGSSGALPNLSITFRAPELDRRPLCALGIHYWVIGAAHGGLMGRLDLDGTWWAIVQGVSVGGEGATAQQAVARRTIEAAGDQEAFLAPSFAFPDLDDDGPAGDALRARLVPVLQVKDSEFHSLGLVLGYDYPDSPAVVPDGGPVPVQELAVYRPSAHPGARLPQAWLPGGVSLYDVLGEGFAVLRLAPDADAAPLAAAAARCSVPLAVVDLADPGLRERYGAGLVLVRPDQHVAWRGDVANDADAILARVTGAADVPAMALPGPHSSR